MIAEQADDHLERALDADAHEDLGSDPKGDQVTGEPVGALLELCVGQLIVAELNGDRLGRAAGLLGDELGQALARVRGRGLVPFAQQPPLGVGAQIEGAERSRVR